jgi:hypothetical protein
MPSPETYLVHLELLLLLLVMCGTQLYTPTATALPGSHPFTTAIMLEPHLAAPLVQVPFWSSVSCSYPQAPSLHSPPLQCLQWLCTRMACVDGFVRRSSVQTTTHTMRCQREKSSRDDLWNFTLCQTVNRAVQCLVASFAGLYLWCLDTQKLKSAARPLQDWACGLSACQGRNCPAQALDMTMNMAPRLG